MPNASNRITDTSVKAMNSMFFMLNSFDECIDITIHPKFYIVINNVSKFGTTYDPETIEKHPNLDIDPQLSYENHIFEFKK